ncbi:cysteine hydrolase family protein [Variovorax sp. PAMC26660]|uniref:cysteine hydrolase family protein n=1 Tax=Variovorax sp. PAMC26660 TaxID=2762322 RepID=UPI0021C3C72E|nr:isochorismatase family protein [Variovorax sp. PAMC26660]
MFNLSRRGLMGALALPCAAGIVGTAAAAASPFAPTPTIRAMSGAQARRQLPGNTTALLVIDFQNEYFTGRMPIADGSGAMAQTKRLLAWADQLAFPVFQIQHLAPAGAAVFAEDGNTVSFHPDMQPRARDTVVQKRTVSVFASTDIARQLQSAHIRTLVITGLMTHACVAGAARDAAAQGFDVVVSSDATATRSIRRENGDTVSHDGLHRAALAEIEDTFGDVLTTAQILALAVA